MDMAQFFNQISGKRIALCGIGRSHLPLAAVFTRKSAKVVLRDARSPEALSEEIKELEKLGVELRLGQDYLADLTEDIIFRTPGMKFSLPPLQEAITRGQVVTSELEVFFKLCPCPIIAVTGSDGKTTTTTIISEFLRAQGKTVHLGGNIGKPLLPEIERIEADHIAVVELSSFQLISMRSGSDISVVTNLAPNHLDWHEDMEEYITAKKQIFLHQDGFSRTVLNLDNAYTAQFASETRGDTLLFSRQQPVAHGAYCKDGGIYLRGEKVLETRQIRISGVHNIENYLAAVCAVDGLVSVENMVKVAAHFDGVEHRMEFVRELDEVKYYNDSIATSPSRTISGTLSLYEEKIVLISGGYDKNLSYEELGPVICRRVKLLILMGATADKIEAAVKASAQYDENEIEVVRVENMAEAVLTARGRTNPGDIVSLSPASAGFDLYPNFEVRGRHYKELVNGLK